MPVPASRYALLVERLGCVEAVAVESLIVERIYCVLRRVPTLRELAALDAAEKAIEPEPGVVYEFFLGAPDTPRALMVWQRPAKRRKRRSAVP